VDLDYFAFRDRPAAAGRPVFIFTGRLSYRPNADAASLLVTRIWPLLRRRWPDAELRVVGARPGARLVELARRANVTLLADVPDIRVHLAAATAALVPMRLGGDMQTKVLEAMAAGVPVVCTRFVNAGIAAAEDAQVLVADTPEEYVRQVERILGDPEGARRQAASARRLIEDRHAPAEFGNRLAELCARLAGGSGLEAPRTPAELLRHTDH
jgi:glycosyltransferase involved in cell wall biosynthesis